MRFEALKAMQRFRLKTRISAYSRVLKYRNLIAQNDKVQNQISRKLSRIQKFASYKSFLEFHLVYKSVCLKFRRHILKKFYLKFEFFLSKIE